VDTDRFDAFSRVLTTTGARRRVLRALTSLGVLGLFGAAEAEAGRKNRRKRRRRRKKRAPRCIANTPPFEAPTAACTASGDCCGTGSCCGFGEDGPACYDLLTNQSACGLSCATADNCVNYVPPRRCVNGACVA
jgi:hypothetical protein